MSRFERTKLKTQRARALRNDMPNAEQKLWAEIRRRRLGGFKFRRQHPFGPYFLDFYCTKIKLCIELDGDQHSNDKAVAHDAKRTAFLENCGICVLRFWNNEVYDELDAVLDAILEQAHYLRREVELVRNVIPSPFQGEVDCADG